MNNRIDRLLLGSLLLSLAACQTGRPSLPTGIYKNSAAFRRQQPSLAGSGAGQVFLARKLYVRNPPGRAERRTKVPLDSAWGYAGADRGAYRIFRRVAYRVEQPDTLAIYSRVVSNGKSTSTIYYFSSGLDGPVIRLSRRKLRQAFANNPPTLNSFQTLKWYQSLDHFDRTPQGRRFRLVALYRQSLGLPAASLR